MVTIDKLAEELKLTGDKTRLTILWYLFERECCVCDLAELLGTSQPNVSQHMRKLKDGGLVKESRRGQWIFYSLNMEDKPYLKGLLGLLPSPKEKLDQAGVGHSNRCQ